MPRGRIVQAGWRSDGDRLGDIRVATLVLRLTMDQHGQLLHAEVVDAGQALSERVNDWSGVIHMLGVWLARQMEGDHESPAADEPEGG